MQIKTPLLIALFILVSLSIRPPAALGSAETNGDVTLTIVGRVVDAQNNGVEDAEIHIFIGGEEAGGIHTNPDGSYIVDLTLPQALIETQPIALQISKPGFRVTRHGFARQEIASSGDHYYVRAPDVMLPRIFNAAFFIATTIFLIVFGSISFNLLHETIAAFLGAALMLGVSYFFGSLNPNFWIIGFHRAITFIDFNV